jgi:murein DD-endopeptidase MepM/ murein hydrolase activator NlpD
MGQSNSTIESVVNVAKFINRVSTPDRSQQIKAAQSQFEEAQRNLKTAQNPARLASLADSAKDNLDIAEEKLAKATTAFNLAAEKLRQAQESQKSPEELQLLEDICTDIQDSHDRASRKVDRLQEQVNLSTAALKQAKELQRPTEQIETELSTHREKLSKASIQFRLRQAELKKAQTALDNARKATKTPEELQVLIDKLNEAQGQFNRASSKVADAKQQYQQATQSAKDAESETIRLEREFTIAAAEYQQITQLTEAEQQSEAIATALGNIERGIEVGRELRQIADPLLDAEKWWNGLCLGATALVAVIYFTPLSSVLQGSVKAVKWIGEGVIAVKDTLDSTWAPDLQSTPKVGETIAGWTVTSAFGRRDAPCSGCSSQHGGVDLADPRGSQYTMGKQLYAIGKPGTKVELTCWRDKGGGGLVATLKPQSLKGQTVEYLHLSKCSLRDGETQTIDAGPVIGAVGNTGHGTAPHAHVQVKDANGKKIPPPRGIVWWAMTGEEPQPVVSQKRLK